MTKQRFKSHFLITLVYLLASLVSFKVLAISYSYDSINRLTNVTYDNGDTIDYVYDVTGNITVVTSNTVTADSDNDGIADAQDNCPLLSNPNQLNTDSDSLGNVCDLDDDNDGIPDSWELLYGLNPLVSSDAGLDGDNDGLTNLAEYTANRNPIVNEAVISIQLILQLLQKPKENHTYPPTYLLNQAK